MFKKKFKLSIIFTAGLSLILIILAMELSYISFSSLTQLGDYAIKMDKENIKKTAALLFLEIANRTAESYSEYFSNTLEHLSILAEQAGDSDENVKIDENYNLKMEKYKDFYIDNKFDDGKVVLYWGNKEKLPSISNKVNDIASWFFPIANGLIQVHKGYFYNIWLIECKENIYIADYYIFKNENDELDLYDKIPGREFLNKYFNKFIDDNAKDLIPKYTKPYLGVTGRLAFTLVCPVVDEGGNLKAIVGADLDIEKILKAMDKANTFAERTMAVSEKLNSIYAKLDGFIFIIDKNGDIILFPESQRTEFSLANSKVKNVNFKDSGNPHIRKLAHEMLQNKNRIYTVDVNGIKHVIATNPISSTGWILGFATHEYALLKAADKTAEKIEVIEQNMEFRFWLITILFLIIVFIVITVFFKKLLFEPIQKIRAEIKKMGEGNFNINIENNYTEEIADLSNAFNYLGRELQTYTENLKHEISARLAIETEISIASKMQTSILPNHKSFSNNSEFEIYSTLIPAKNVSGDFYDYFKLDEDNLAFIIADVSGKGMQAAFFMSMTKVLIKNFASKFKDSPAELLNYVNNALLTDNKACMFVTVFIAFYNIKTGELVSANGGHHNAIILNKNGKCKYFGASNSIAVGIIPDPGYKQHKTTINKEETFILYTDGVIEAMSLKEEEYGEERLLNVIKSNHTASLKKLSDIILEDVNKFESGIQFDDITIVMLKRN